MKVYRDSDADLALVRSRRIAILGFGNQGRAQALNLRDSGVGELVVGLAESSPSRARAEAEGLGVMTPVEAAGWADIAVFLPPDESHARLYAEAVGPNL